jgi:hypothetical protein
MPQVHDVSEGHWRVLDAGTGAQRLEHAADLCVTGSRHRAIQHAAILLKVIFTLIEDRRVATGGWQAVVSVAGEHHYHSISPAPFE